MNRLVIALVLLVSAALPGRAGDVAAQKVTFPALASQRENIMLSAELYHPMGTGPFGAVVLLHGCYGVEDVHRQWAQDFVRRGMVALVVDSLTPRGRKEVCTDVSAVGPYQRAGDAYAARHYLASLDFVDGDRIALAGWSHGGWTLLQAIDPSSNAARGFAAEGGRFAAAVAIYPYCDVIEKFDTPLLILIGDRDDWTPKYLCDRTVAASNNLGADPPVAYQVYDGATHSFDDPFAADVAAIARWIASAPGIATIEPKGGFRYLGHLIRYDAKATEDARERVGRFLAAMGKP